MNEIDYKKEWLYQKKQADQWFEAYDRLMDLFQELTNKLNECEKRRKKK
jgi:hypothetical protein